MFQHPNDATPKILLYSMRIALGKSDSNTLYMYIIRKRHITTHIKYIMEDGAIGYRRMLIKNIYNEKV